MTPDVETLREALDEWRDSEARPLANVDGMVAVLEGARFALSILDPSPETVERVAKALCWWRSDEPDLDWTVLRSTYDAEARAVLAVLVAPQEGENYE